MLNVIEYGKDEYDFPALLVLGCFDAIHVGHRDLIKKAKLQAKINGLDLGVMLFRDGKGGKTVYSFEERLAVLEEFNVKFVLVIDFTDEFKNTSPEDFLHAIEDKVNVKAYMSGKDFRFGAKAKGKSSTLKNYAEDEDNGVWYMPVKDVTVNDVKVSTTQIKEKLESGAVAEANELLGSEFCVCGEVVQGAGRGASRLGYPTVNIVYPENKFQLKQGVYKVKSTIGETEYFGIANYGNCPTFGDDRIALEVHFEEFEGNLYGETLKISFLDYIRDIVAFASCEELVKQLDADKALLAADIAEQKEKQAAQAAAAEAVSAVEETPKPVEEAPVIEEVVTEEVSQPVEETVVEEVIQPEEETAVEEEVQPSEEDIEITPEEFKELDSGFGDIVEEPVEEVVQTEEILEEIVEETAEETAEVKETEAEPVEEASEETEVEPVFVEEEAETEEVVGEITEETAEEETLTEEALEEFEVIEEQPEEEIEVVGDGFDDIVEEPVEEITATEEAESALESAEEGVVEPVFVDEEPEKEEISEELTEETVEETEEEIQPEEESGGEETGEQAAESFEEETQSVEVTEMTEEDVQTEDAAEVTEEEEKQEEAQGEDKID